MKALIVSLGSIGQRHLANLLCLEPSAEITVMRRQAKVTESVAGARRVVSTLEDAIDPLPLR